MLNKIKPHNINHFKIYFQHRNTSQKSINLLKKQYTCCGHILKDDLKSNAYGRPKNTPQVYCSQKRLHSTMTGQKIPPHLPTQNNFKGVPQNRPHSILNENIPIFRNQIRLLTQNRPTISQNRPTISQNRPTISQNRLTISQNRPNISQYSPIQILKRVHSTHSDQHRQKVVIETSSPNVIDKLRLEKLVPVGKGQTFWDKIDPYVKLARWDKPIGVYLLYWPCTWSISLATIDTGVDVSTGAYTAGLFLVGAGLMRGAGCTINDMWDKDIDKQVERTSSRPLASGTVSTKQALIFLAAQLSAALGILLQLNCFSVALGASSMLLVVAYPLAKRFTNYPQVFLGATFNWGALLGYSAVSGALGLHTLPLYAGALAWTIVYDTIYAHQDKADDARIGIKSCALSFGAHCKPLLSLALATSSTCLLAAGEGAGLSEIYYLAVAGYTAHVARQIYTLDMDNPKDCDKKFKSNSLVGLIILLGILGGGVNKYKENREKNQGKNLSEKAESCLFSQITDQRS